MRPRQGVEDALIRLRLAWQYGRRPRPVDYVRIWAASWLTPARVRPYVVEATQRAEDETAGQVDFHVTRASRPGSPQEDAERMVRYAKERGIPVQLATLGGFPHCDQRVLHAPGTCEVCDRHPEWQELRRAWGVAFTGDSPSGVLQPSDDGHFHSRVWRKRWAKNVGAPSVVLPCPADFMRPAGSESDHRRWAGNVATTGHPVNESGASRLLYPLAKREGE